MSKLINQQAITKLAQGLHRKSKDLVAVERNRALEVEGQINAKVDKNISDIAAINNAETGILKQAKDYVDAAIEGVDTSALGSRIAAVETKNIEQDKEIAKKVAKADVVNGLKETLEGKVLDARQGKVLKDLVDGEVTRATTAEGVLAGRLDVIEGVGEGSINKALEDAKVYTDGKIGEVNGAISGLEGRVATNESAISDIKDVLANKNSNTIVVDTEDEIAVANPNPKVGDIAFVINGTNGKKAYIYKGVDALAVESIPDGWVVFDEITNELDLVNYLKKTDAEATYRKIADKITEGDLAVNLAAKINNKADTATVNAALDLKANQNTLESEVASARTFATSEAQREAGVVDRKLTSAKAELQGNINTVDGKVEANKSAIAVLNGDVSTTGSIDKKIKDALTPYSNTAAVKSMLTNVVGSLTLSIVEDQVVLSAGGVDGVEISKTSLDMITNAEIDEILAGLN